MQLDLSNDTAAVSNTTIEAHSGLKLSARVYSLDNRLLLSKEATINAAADAITAGFPLELAPLMGDGVVLVRLELQSADGQHVSRQFLLACRHDAGYRALTRLPEATVTATAARAAARRSVSICAMAGR